MTLQRAQWFCSNLFWCSVVKFARSPGCGHEVAGEVGGARYLVGADSAGERRLDELGAHGILTSPTGTDPVEFKLERPIRAVGQDDPDLDGERRLKRLGLGRSTEDRRLKRFEFNDDLIPDAAGRVD